MNESIIHTALPVMQAFYTLQGEGFHQGKAAYFIRLGGCDVECFWCDIKQSWDETKHPAKSIEEIVHEARLHTSPTGGRRKGAMIVVTGGEPLMHNLVALTTALKKENLQTHIETSGSHTLSGNWDWICLSPKKFKPPLPEIIPLANELKVVIYNKHDFIWAEQFAQKVSEHCKLYLQPEWGQSTKVTPLIIDYIKKNPQWELSLQLHKYINVP
ncbi:MAG: 7-carboxy-7-deazaguanine synthase QueE [Parafilimonas sp.]